MISRFFNFHACVCTLQAYNCSVELSWAPFLVRQNKIPAPVNATGNAKESETLQIDTIDEQAEDWKRAHILVFNTGHWWTHPEPRKGYVTFLLFSCLTVFDLSSANNRDLHFLLILSIEKV